MKSSAPINLALLTALALLSASAHAKTVYVNNNSSCVLPSCTGATANVGSTSTSAFKRLTEAMTLVFPGDTLSIAYSSSPYYIYDSGLKPTGVFSFPKAILDLDLNIGGQTPSSPTKIVGTGNSYPVIRGSLKFTGWQRIGSTNRYYLTWPLLRDDGGGKLEPQQIFRNVSGTELQLKQVGGEVYGGYPTVVPSDLAVAATIPLWPGRIAPNFATPGVPSSVVMTPNQFYYDRVNNYIYVELNPGNPVLSSTEALEVSVMRHLVKGSALNKLEISGIKFERTNTSTYFRGGALSLNGTGILVKSSVVQDADSQGIDLSGNANSIITSTIQRSGQTGIHASGSGHWIASNVINYNNTRGFEPAWEAGGMKNIGDVPFFNSYIGTNTVAFNNADGIWIDTAGNGNTIDMNVVAYNSSIGIHIETSSNQIIKRNVIIGNSAQGIQLVDSSNNTINNNRIVWNNKGGIYSVNDTRVVTPVYDVSIGNNIHHNVIAWNDDYINRKSVEINSETTLDYNTYCGTKASIDGNTGLPSLHFWVSNFSSGANIYWFSNWKTLSGTTVSSRDLNSTMKTTSNVSTDPTYPASIRDYVLWQNLDNIDNMNLTIDSAITSYCR